MIAASAALLLGGCATMAPTSSVTAPVESRNTQVQQARELAQAGAALSGAARSDSDRQIERLLSGLDNATLAAEAARLPAGDPLYNYAGRALLRRGLPLPRPFDRGEAWRFDAGNRPPADRDGYRPPVKVAMLLPLSGSMAAATAPVRDGFLAGYYGETRRRPEIVFYDTQGNAGGTLSAYERAAAEGSDFVVGPLGRDEVSALFNRAELPVPVLALNRGTVAPPSGHASFSLAPEDEGIAAAEFLLERNARRVLVITGDDESQRRAVASLRERLAERGALVTDSVGEGTADLAPFAQKEGGVDAVFIATRGSAARTLMPKLALAGLAGKPRVATSQLLAGTGKPAEDRVLDGIAFPGETWTLRGTRGLPSAASAAAMLPTAKGPAARLFAFGFDAWQLTAYLERLATTADGAVEGATGVLRMDGFGVVQRTPAWSTFSGGVAVPLADAARR
ncbi:penicillin-binding protein activator [Cognatilysobacter tabacisoli]|uniref:penicillin-binding protein activator n=1 Tax=Cognatilysobacter tabacisoli TaxID=2315424 RepID=UPI0018C88180|nr:penicillin-binding protein activator [Lysobacter tabacisoli]